jgi:Cu/Ag efflux protein CusF
MNRILPPVLGLALTVSACGFAYSVFHSTGLITKIDATADAVTLDNGKTYNFPATVDLSKVKVGDKVQVTFTMQVDAKNHASAIVPAT